MPLLRGDQVRVLVRSNYSIGLQTVVGADGSPGSEGVGSAVQPTVLPLLQSVHTLRFTLFHRAALLVRPQGVPVLRLTENADTRRVFTRIQHALARVA